MMRACESYIDLMMRSIDRDTTPQEEAKIQNHLAQCETCRALYETYRALDAGIVAAEEEPPETLTRAVMNSIHAEQRERSPRHLLKRFRFTAVAATAAILVLVFARFQPNVLSVTSDSMNTSPEMEVVVPQVEAELRASAEAPESQDTVLARAADIQEEPLEEAADVECSPEEVETPMAAADGDATAVAAAEEGADKTTLSQVTDSLRAMGLHGDVLLVSGILEVELMNLFPEVAVIELETGETVYEVLAEAVELATASGELVVSEHCEIDSLSGNDYLILFD